MTFPNSNVEESKGSEEEFLDFWKWLYAATKDRSQLENCVGLGGRVQRISLVFFFFVRSLWTLHLDGVEVQETTHYQEESD